MTLPEGPLQSFVASVSIEDLTLDADMTLEQILSLLSSIDVSRLKVLKLWTLSFDSAMADAILDGVRHATKLERLHLVKADITQDQKERMKAKGVYLFNTRWETVK